MADVREIVTGDSPEAVAYALLFGIGKAEGKATNQGTLVADRKWMLDTYAECLSAVKGHRKSPNP